MIEAAAAPPAVRADDATPGWRLARRALFTFCAGRLEDIR